MKEQKYLASREALRVAALSMREQEKLLLRGEAPDPEALAGWEFRGLNPAWMMAVGNQKFIKGFYKSTTTGDLYGYNMVTKQNRMSQPWEAKTPTKRFGFYRVSAVDPEARDNAYLHALFLDYGRGGNAKLDPTSTLRDYLVRIERGSDDLLLGKAYLALGPLRVRASFFVLERQAPSDFKR